MAIDATEILCKHKEDHHLSEKNCIDLSHIATYVRTVDESKTIDTMLMPKIIVSASGMATGGRVLHHLKTYAPDYKNTILFTGYQSGGTRGDRLIKGEKEIKLLGQLITVRAKIQMLTSVSAHADYEEILAWLSHFKRPPKKTFITHGEPTAALSLKNKIQERFGWKCIIPHYRQRESLT